MIIVRPSPTADTRTCDYANVTKDQLLDSSRQHVNDVRRAFAFFEAMIVHAKAVHDADKITDIDSFHADFITGFKQTDWWHRHRAINRHHLLAEDGIPKDVNLIDVLDFIADMVMASTARGSTFSITLSPELLTRAFHNTVGLLKSEVKLVEVYEDGGENVRQR